MFTICKIISFSRHGKVWIFGGIIVISLSITCISLIKCISAPHQIKFRKKRNNSSNGYCQQLRIMLFTRIRSSTLILLIDQIPFQFYYCKICLSEWVVFMDANEVIFDNKEGKRCGSMKANAWTHHLDPNRRLTSRKLTTITLN